MKGANYTIVKEPDKDIITLYSNDSKYWDVIFIKGRWSPPVLVLVWIFSPLKVQ